jgi:hypothetical protein
VLFNSNGIALTAKRGQELIDAGQDEYRLSMDGATRETYAHVRGVDAFDKIWRNMRAFVAMQKEQNARPLLLLAPPHPWRAWYVQIFFGMGIVPGLVVVVPTH